MATIICVRPLLWRFHFKSCRHCCAPGRLEQASMPGDMAKIRHEFALNVTGCWRACRLPGIDIRGTRSLLGLPPEYPDSDALRARPSRIHAKCALSTFVVRCGKSSMFTLADNRGDIGPTPKPRLFTCVVDLSHSPLPEQPMKSPRENS